MTDLIITSSDILHGIIGVNISLIQALDRGGSVKIEDVLEYMETQIQQDGIAVGELYVLKIMKESLETVLHARNGFKPKLSIIKTDKQEE